MNSLLKFIRNAAAFVAVTATAATGPSTFPDGLNQVEDKLNKQVFEGALTSASQEPLAKLTKLLTLKLAARGNLEQYQQVQKRSPLATYLLQAVGSGEIVRWSHMPILVKVIPPTKLTKNNTDFTKMTIAALSDLQQQTDNLIKFHVLTKEHDEPRFVVQWTAQQDLQATTTNTSVSGNTTLWTAGNTIIRATLTISPYQNNGQLLPPAALEAVVIHEALHGLGIDGHSPNPSDMMFYCRNPRSCPKLTLADIATLRALYQFRPTVTERPELTATTAQEFAEALKVGHHLEFLNNNGLPSLERAVHLNPQDATANYILGMGYYHHDELLKAKTTLQHACQLLPTQPEAHAYLSLVALQEAKHREKLTPFQKEEALRTSTKEIQLALQLSNNAHFIRQLENTQADMAKELAGRK